MDFIENSLTSREDSKKSKQSYGNKWSVLAISSIPLVMTLGNSMLIPVLPAMEDKLNISSFQSSLIITVYSIVAIILIPIAGFLSDHIGRKKVIIPSLAIAAIGGLISGWAAWKIKDPYWIILVGRALQGIGAAGAAPIVMPLVGDMFKSEKEVSSTLGIIETSNTLGKVISPILGAFLATFIWFIPFLSFPIFCLISILLMALFVRRGKTEYEPIPFKEFIYQLKKIFKNNGRWLLAIFAIGIILMFVLFGVLFYLSEVLEREHHIMNVKKGLYLALPLGALCLTSLITGKIIKENKILMKWITFTGLLLMSLSIVSLSFSKGMWFMIIMFLLSGIGIGASLPCLDAIITEGIQKDQRGTITSIYHSMRFIGVAAGPPVIAILLNQLEGSLFYILAIIGVSAVLLTLFAIKPDKEKK
ncbi:multidrug resistance protein [Robertmurraya siralis]|uniref:Multidrug resistance protein n=1 Tax=Robertmurraya siralis TaxID=77777 RepID=A0A920BSG9_9BACI|nr:MFS transporter [Robertmurraya siralis]PAE22621.1 MFS transporter [Bacillus sp. 7504-2]GIN60963.1 multidrug resistance protein [Robertmurraya siralis]